LTVDREAEGALDALIRLALAVNNPAEALDYLRRYTLVVGDDVSGLQERLLELLVGRVRSGRSAPESPAENFVRIFDAQHLIAVDSLFAVADGAGKGGMDPKAMRNIDDQLGRLEDAGSVRGSLSSAEQSAPVVG